MARLRFLRVLAIAVCAAAGASSGQFLEAVVPTGDTPGEIIWDPAVNKVYCVNEQDASITVISGETNQVLATIQVGDYPSFLCLNADGSKLYCSRGEENRLVVVDTRADTVIKTLNLPNYPGHMVFNSTMSKLYISCNDDPVYRIAVLDAMADTVIRYIPAREVGRLLWSPATNRVFCCGADTIKVIDCLTDEIAVRMQGGGDVWCYNAVNDLVYLAARHSIYVLSPYGDSVVAQVPGWAYDVAAVPFTNKVYASGSAAGIQVIDGASNLVVDTIPVVAGGMVCDTSKGRLYALGAGVHILDARADTLIKTIPLGNAPRAICWNRTNSRVYISDEFDNVVYVIRDTSTGVAEGNSLGRSSVLFEARPNPFRSSVLIRCLHEAGQDAPVRIYAQTGMLVRTLAGGGPWHWDGRDDHGRPVPAGVYVLRSTGEAGALLVVKSG